MNNTCGVRCANIRETFVVNHAVQQFSAANYHFFVFCRHYMPDQLFNADECNIWTRACTIHYKRNGVR